MIIGSVTVSRQDTTKKNITEVPVKAILKE